MATTLEIQRRLQALGFSPGPLDGIDGPQTRAAVTEFQRANGLTPDGIVGPITTAALFPADAAAPAPAPSPHPPAAGAGVPAAWMPQANMRGIIVHWTAGNHSASTTDRQHYHILIEGDGKLVRGNPSIALNSLPRAQPGSAAHTLNSNTGWIGVSLCCMAGAVESPFNAGRAPMTRIAVGCLAAGAGLALPPLRHHGIAAHRFVAC